jgi:hypothetical protein
MKKPAKRTALVPVDNPFYSPAQPDGGGNPRTVEAVVNLRESSVITLAAHGVLNAAQVAAAFRFRNSWDAVQAARPASIGFEDWVQVGRPPVTFAEHQLAAAGDLRSCRDKIGEHGYVLLATVCGKGYHIRDMFRTRRERDTMTDLLRLHLDALAAMWRVSR